MAALGQQTTSKHNFTIINYYETKSSIVIYKLN